MSSRARTRRRPAPRSTPPGRRAGDVDVAGEVEPFTRASASLPAARSGLDRAARDEADAEAARTALRTDSWRPSSSGTSRSRSLMPLLRSSSSNICPDAGALLHQDQRPLDSSSSATVGRRTGARAGRRGSPRRGRTARTRRCGAGGAAPTIPSSSRRSATSSTTDCVSETDSSTRSSALARWNSQRRRGRTIGGGAGGGADLERPAQRLVRLGDLVEQLLLEREHPLRAAVEPQPGLGRLDPAAGAVEELRPEPLLERAHLLETAGCVTPSRAAASEKLRRSTTSQNAASCRVSISEAYPAAPLEWLDARLGRPHQLAARARLPAADPLLRERGHEVEVTAREYAQTMQLLELHGIEATSSGGTAAPRARQGARRGLRACRRCGAGRSRALRPRARPRLARPDADRAVARDPERDDLRLRVRVAPAPARLPRGDAGRRPRGDPG